jgi:hypothetical protein
VRCYSGYQKGIVPISFYLFRMQLQGQVNGGGGMVEKITSELKLASVFDSALYSVKSRGIVFFIGVWVLYFVLAYCMLVQFSLVRDGLGLLTPIVFYVAVGCLVCKVVVVAVKIRRISLIKSSSYALTAVAMLIFARPSILFFSNCFHCSVPTAILRIAISNECVSLVNVGNGSSLCKLYSTSYNNGEYSIFVFDSRKVEAVSAMGTILETEEKQRDFYVVFDRYLVLYQWIPYYLGPMGSPYF